MPAGYAADRLPGLQGLIDQKNLFVVTPPGPSSAPSTLTRIRYMTLRPDLRSYPQSSRRTTQVGLRRNHTFTALQAPPSSNWAKRSRNRKVEYLTGCSLSAVSLCNTAEPKRTRFTARHREHRTGTRQTIRVIDWLWSATFTLRVNESSQLI